MSDNKPPSDRAGAPVQEVLEASIHQDWDAPLTYDVLRDPGKSHGFFVGREELLLPLVAAMAEPEKRGTILVSGYRGTGKTTLVIEALRRTAVQMSPPHNTEAATLRILPIVLNVSEVAASLGIDKTDLPKLQIDPKRLLISLLRAFRQRDDCFKDEKYKEIRDKVHALYRKATAAEFKQSQSADRVSSKAEERSVTASLKTDDFFKGILGPAGCIAIGLAAIGSPDTVAGDILRVLASLGGLLALGIGLTYSVTRSQKQTAEVAEKFSISHDNSLQQLENDLRDLLLSLKEVDFRTVVVLEELDKLDAQGEELDLVIRYFKNLFTQAPALFVFVTDKAYFDRIEHEIRQARRGRSYAISHTFFTHRIFVGRPSTQDCVAFIRKLLSNERDRNILAKVYTSQQLAFESFGQRTGDDNTSTFSRFVRVLLFRACNHLFDLKAELQKFVRLSGATPVLRFDADLFPPDEHALAKFQDLIVEKFETFKFKGGRAYANEVLQDCLSGVFHDMDTGTARPVAQMLPDATSLKDGPLDTTEHRRIADAVGSMLDDLHRGGAVIRRNDRVEYSPSQDVASTVEGGDRVEWQMRPAESFRLMRRLERHEEELVAGLNRVRIKAAEQLNLWPPESIGWTEANEFVTSLQQQIDAAGNLGTLIGVDDALQIRQKAENQLELSQATLREQILIQALDQAGIALASVSVGAMEPGSGVRILQFSESGNSDYYNNSLDGVVAVVLGNRIDLLDTLKEFADTAAPKKLSVVHLSSEQTTATTPTAASQWVKALTSSASSKHQRFVQVATLSVSDIGSLADASAGRRLAQEMIASALWAVRPRPTSSVKKVAPSLPISEAERTAVDAWLSLPKDHRARVLGSYSDVDSHFWTIQEFIWQYKPEIPFALAIELDTEQSSPLSISSSAAAIFEVIGVNSVSDFQRMARVHAVTAILSAATAGPGIVCLRDDPGVYTQSALDILKSHWWVTEARKVVEILDLPRNESGSLCWGMLDVAKLVAPPA